MLTEQDLSLLKSIKTIELNNNLKSYLLSCAAYYGLEQTVVYLLEQKAKEIEIPIALDFEVNILIVQLFKDIGIEIPKGNLVGGEQLRKLPLELALINGHINIAEQLVKNGSDVNQEIKAYGFGFFSPPHLLYKMTEKQNHAAVLFLVKNGALVDKADSYGNSALHRAVHFGDGKMAKILVDAGADIHLRAIGNDNLSPFEMAEKYGNSSLLDLFKSSKIQNS